jgi:hypothetical protein
VLAHGGHPRSAAAAALYAEPMRRMAGLLAAVAPLISADTNRLGHIDLYLGDVQGTTGRFFEKVGGHRVPVGQVTVDGPAPAHLVDALTWSCTRRTRNLVADVVHPDGSTASATTAVRTPSCSDRLAIAAPRSAPPGALVTVGVIDRWGLGDVSPLLCVRSPSGRRTCRPVRFGGRRRSALGVRLTRDGTWRLDVVLAGLHTRRTLAAGFSATPGPARARPNLLVTGDSTVQGIDAVLGDRLRRSFRLVRDFRPGSGIGHDGDHWPRIAVAEARRFEPRVTVVSIGATEGFPMRAPDGTTATCCAAAWQAEYERRVRAVMTALVRDGRGRVLWLMLPTPQDPRRAVIWDVVNTVAIRAAGSVPGVTVVHVERVLSPGGRFRHALRYRGRRRVVRAADGIHLTPAGAAIASDLILRVLSRVERAS